MFRLMRNTHLALGLVFVAMAMIFAVSSLVFIYRPWLPKGNTETEQTVTVPADQAGTPRELALVLMREHGAKGEMRQIEEEGDVVRFRIVRPGTEAQVEYDRTSGQATIKTTKRHVLEVLTQLHTNHGFWHDFFPSQAWAAISLLSSIGLLLLGATGIYLWFAHHKERVIGGVLLGFGLIYGLVTLVLVRIA